jgi:hypothetical protein
MSDTFLPELHSPEARQAVAELLLALFRRWALAEDKQAELLALDGIGPLLRGEPLPDRYETLERAGLIMAIDRSLQRQFADDRVLCDDWVVFPNAAFDGRSPLAVMLEGLDGIRRVWRLLRTG